MKAQTNLVMEPRNTMGEEMLAMEMMVWRTMALLETQGAQICREREQQGDECAGIIAAGMLQLAQRTARELQKRYAALHAAYTQVREAQKAADSN